MDDTELHKGSIVIHPHFGKGIVLIETQGSVFAEVKFETGIVRTVSICNLEVLSDNV